jgi:dienelactone hydrolase
VNAQNLRTDQWLSEPVDQQTFATYLDFFRYEAALPFDAQVRVDQEGELAVERLTFTSTQAERVTANLYHPQGAAFGLRSVVFIHGGGPLGKDGPVELTGLLARAGWTVLAFDMKHYGERRTNVLTTYSPQDKADNLYNRPSLYLQWMTQNVKDAGRALDYLVRERNVNPERVVLVGFSRGAQVAMIAGGADRRFAGVVLLHGGHFDANETGHRAAACPANYIGRIQPRPLFMINATNDNDYWAETSVRPLQRIAGPRATLRWNESTSHGILDDEDKAALVDWLRRAFP